MLVASLVRQTLGVKDHRVMSVVGDRTGIVVRLDRRRLRRLPCSVCGTRSPFHDRLRERTWRHVPLWGIPARIVYAPARVRCRACGIKVEKIPWGPSKSPLSLPLVICLATWTRLLAMDVVAALFGVAWSTVASAVRQAVAHGLVRRDTDGVVLLGIDEISRKKGHVYHTQVYDLERRRLLWSGEGRGEETIQAFFEQWGKERCARVVGVCCDMWAPYVDAIKEACPDAILVFDKFHIVRHLLSAVDKVRKEEVRRLKKEHPSLLAGTKYLWLKNPWNLTPKQRQRLGHLERLNLRIHRAWLLKEAFREFWEYRGRGWARRFLKKWFWWATHSRLAPMRDFAWMLRRHEDGLLSYFDLRLDNGAVEAMNNVAKSISHRAHGFRSATWFSTALLHCMGDLPLPAFVHKFS
jgi:transposase